MLIVWCICLGMFATTFSLRITNISEVTKERIITTAMKSIVSLSLISFVPQNVVGSDGTEITSVQEAADIITKYCKKSLEISRQTGRVLYRGTSEIQLTKGLTERKLSIGKNSLDNSNSSNRITVDSPRSDLLNENTYNNPLSIDYFTAIDKEFPLVFKQGDYVTLQNGHLATTDSQLASLWGPVVAIFPFDDYYYCTLRHEKTWFNEGWISRGNKNFLFWKQRDKLQSFVRNELVFNDLDSVESAYSKGSEILFTSHSSVGQYIAIPLQYLGKLLLLLNIEPYTTRVKVTRAPVIEVDEVKQRRKPRPQDIIYF